MKIIFLTAFTACSFYVSAQQTNNIVNSSGIPVTVDFNQVTSTSSGKALKYSDIQGSPYLSNDYKKIKIGDFVDIVPAKYNAYTDEVEIKVNDKVQSLPKDETFSHIKFVESNENLLYIFDDLEKGYYYILQDGETKLLRRNVIRFVDEKPAPSSYASAQPAKFQALKPTYFFYKDSKLVPIKKESGLIKAFPEKDINSVIKGKKIKLDKEKDLIELAKSLN